MDDDDDKWLVLIICVHIDDDEVETIVLVDETDEVVDEDDKLLVDETLYNVTFYEEFNEHVDLMFEVVQHHEVDDEYVVVEVGRLDELEYL